MHDKPARFDRTQIFLHWTIGLGIILLASAELLRGQFPKGSLIREGLKPLHMPIGTMIFALILFRVIWRFTHKAPAAPDNQPSLERLASAGTHALLYVMMVAIPLLGIVATLGGAKPIDFGLFQIVYPLNGLMSAGTAKSLRSVHELLGQAILALAFLHAAAALYHHYVRRDDVMARMLPQRKAVATRAAARNDELLMQ